MPGHNRRPSPAHNAPEAYSLAPSRTLKHRFDSRANAIGALRLVFAMSVIVSHAFPLGYGRRNPLSVFSRGQTDLGTLAVAGFFVLSGFLITRSAQRQSLARYAWHRALRIFPAFWTCLIVTAGVLAPALWAIRAKSLAGFLTTAPGPGNYVLTNWWASMREYGIDHLLITTPYGQMTGRSVFDGSLWSLRYELICYILVGGLAALGATGRRRGLMILATGVLAGMIVQDWLLHGRFGAASSTFPKGVVPLLGGLDGGKAIPLAFLFLLGGLAALYPERIIIRRSLAMIAGVILLLSMRLGGYDVVGVIAFAYLVLWLAVCLPKSAHSVGTRRDFSYGIYIYAFPIQQVLALFHVNRLGLPIYLAVSSGGAVLAGAASWYLIEKNALKLKDQRLPGRRKGDDEASTTPRRASEL